eukprot:gene14758-biopygen11844
MESLKDHTRTIEVKELLNMLKDDKHRIFFVGGVAGIGKSVLAKRIAYDWSCNEKYEHVKCLLYITCRELNEFLEKSDKEIGIEEIEKYLKEKFKDVPIEDDKATLFLIDGLDELQKHDLIQAFTEKFSESNFVILGRPHSRHFLDKTEEMCQNFVRFSLIKETSFEEDDELSYQLVEKLANGKEVAENRGDGVITYEDAQSVIRGILNQLPNDEFSLKVRFLADCFVASDKVRDVKFLVELLKSIKPSSNVRVKLNSFDESNLLSILKLATGNKVAYSEIKNAFSGIEFDIDDLREMEILGYARWIDIDVVRLNDVNHFTEDQLMLVHRNVVFCGKVKFHNCKVPLFTTNANESTTRMKLELLRMSSMKIDESEVSSAANLIGLAEGVWLNDVRFGGNEFEKMMEKLIQLKPRRLKRMDLWYCPLVNHDIKQKMKENGVTIKEVYERNNAEMAIELNRMISAIIDNKFIVISNAPGNQVEADQIKQKFADEIGCPVLVNIELKKSEPRVVVVLLTDGYEESQQCKEMMDYVKPWRKIIAVKLDNDFQPGDRLNDIVSWRTCICWTDETNFDTNFAKVKEEINAKFVISKYVNWKKAGKLIAGTSSECLEKLSELSSFSQEHELVVDTLDCPSWIDRQGMISISYATNDQSEAVNVKKQLEASMGRSLFANLSLMQYRPLVIVTITTAVYEKSDRCRNMVKYLKLHESSAFKPKIVTVMLQNDFQPSGELKEIVGESTSICWADKANLDANFSMVKEEINSFLEKWRIQ